MVKRKPRAHFGPEKITRSQAKFLAELYKRPTEKIEPDETKRNFFEELVDDKKD